MKRSTIILSLFAAALMVSCSKDTDLSDNLKLQDPDGAYVSVRISQPTTRADEVDQEGTEEESTVSNVKLLIFDKDYNYIGLGEKGTSQANNIFNFEVAPDAYRFFVVVNSTASIDEALKNISGNWNTVESSLQSILSLDSRTDLDAYKRDYKFTMVNAGSYADNKESILVRPLDANLVNNKLSIDKTDPTDITINVDRMVAKFTAKVVSPLKVTDDRTVDGVDQPDLLGEVKGVRLNVVNKKSYIYSHINQVNSDGDDYREDPNMSVVGEAAKPQGEATSLLDNFFWLHNYESPEFSPVSSGSDYTEYAFENTATGEFFNYNNLTQLVVKALYRPTGQPDPTDLEEGYTTVLTHDKDDANSWFAINIEGYGTMQMTFKGVVEFYSSPLTVDDTRTKMDAQLRHMLKSAAVTNGLDIATAKWNDPKLNCKDVLNSIPNGGYVAATVPDAKNYIVQFYQFGLNYYDIFIQHDENQGVGHLGRWGMVRNNHYTLTIRSITGPGLPYIPDPTDPEIKDPKNPKPTDPEPADDGMAYIDATIDVNDWTMWTQNVDLNYKD